MKEYDFLKEYVDLCKKYKMGLKGCGCCGSPYLYSKEKYIDNINYNSKLDEVYIGGNGFYHELVEEGEYNEKDYGDAIKEEKTLNEYFEVIEYE